MGLSCFKSSKHDRTGHKGNRDVLVSPGSYFFLSNSAGQGDEWLKSLNKGVWIPFTGVFGQRLEETVLYERRYGVRAVPLVVEQCVCFLRQRGLLEVGLFRLPGRASLVRELQDAFDAGERPTFDSNTDVHTVASLLKLYLRQLPEPLVPHARYPQFLLCGQKLTSNRQLGLIQLKNLVHELPVANFNLLYFLCQFLDDVQSHSSSNKMSCQNLATVFGPNILRAKAEDPHSIMGGAVLVQLLMLELIREQASLFSTDAPPLCAPGGPRPPLSAALRPRLRPQLHPPPCLRQLSLPLIAHSGDAAQQDGGSCSSCAAADPVGRPKLLGHRYTSSQPESCFAPPPSSAGPDAPPRHGAPRRPSPSCSLGAEDGLLSWAQAWTDMGEAGVHFWSSDAAEGGGEEAAIPEAASGGSSEAQEGSTRSVYDNLELLTPPRRTAHARSGDNERNEREGAGPTAGSSSCSSCEGLPLDESAGPGDAGGGASPASNKEAESEHGDDDDDDDDEDEDDDSDGESKGDDDDDRHDDEDDEDEGDLPHATPPTSPAVSPLSTGSSEVFLPSGPPDQQGATAAPRLADAHSLLNALRRQMLRQQGEYQASVQRLERSNDALQRQIAVLRVNLEQQRRSQSVAEMKIRNMERAKADAELRNSTLQREMEIFFRLYGQIRGGGPRQRSLQSL